MPTKLERVTTNLSPRHAAWLRDKTAAGASLSSLLGELIEEAIVAEGAELADAALAAASAGDRAVLRRARREVVLSVFGRQAELFVGVPLSDVAAGRTASATVPVGLPGAALAVRATVSCVLH